MKKVFWIWFILFCVTVGAHCASARAQSDSLSLDSIGEKQMGRVVIKAPVSNKSKLRVTNTEIIGQQQLKRAACCNLGESFVNNPSVDVTYSDAATGAKQIKLLGLGGTYVQMLTEGVPNLRGAALPYSLGYVPGPWLQSIQVSKGAASVKNGYESVTGQIDVEFFKPQFDEALRANAYVDSRLRHEANVVGTTRLSDRLSGGLFLHFENRQNAHDSNNDGFLDMPKVEQYNVLNRWAWVSPSVISQLSVAAVGSMRRSGSSHHHYSSEMPRYVVDNNTRRFETQWKNAYMFNDDRNSSVALIAHASWHDADNLFGTTRYDVKQLNLYGQLMYETQFGDDLLSVGASVNHDGYDERIGGNAIFSNLGKTKETVSGVYAQYTYKYGKLLTLMPGLRYDYSSLYGGFLTPRVHLKIMPIDRFSLRLSAGKGYHSPHALAENVTLLASGRNYYVDDNLKQEKAWNYGIAANGSVKIGKRTADLNLEYYYTRFENQTVVDFDGRGGPYSVSFYNLDGKSYSHTVQADATCTLFDRTTLGMALRYSDVKTTYNGVTRRPPLVARYKALMNVSYKTPLELWQFDVTGHVNGGGELYDGSSYHAFFQLMAQVTREFRRFSVYLGGENLTNYKMKNPIVSAANPWSRAFDATQVWGPTEGRMIYLGLRFKLEKL